MIMPYNHDDLLTTDRSTPIFKLWIPLELVSRGSGVNDLHLDGPLSRVRGDVESLDSLFEGEPVADQGLEVDQPSGD